MLADKMQTFLEDNCHVVDTTTDEHSHGYWEVFEAYQRRIDGILESFVEAEGLHDRSQMLRTIKAACTKFDFADDYIQQMLVSGFPLIDMRTLALVPIKSIAVPSCMLSPLQLY
jgi:hypothetical protein